MNISRRHITFSHRGVVPAGAWGAMATPDFGRSVNPISTKGDRLCPPHYYWHGTPGFSDLPTALFASKKFKITPQIFTAIPIKYQLSSVSKTKQKNCDLS